MLTRNAGTATKIATLIAATVLLNTTAQAAVSMVTGSVPSGGVRTHSVNVGYDDDFVLVRGDGRSGADLDCWIYQDGELVDSDTDDTDYCVLETPGLGVHQLRIKNYGSLTNYYTVSKR